MPTKKQVGIEWNKITFDLESSMPYLCNDTFLTKLCVSYSVLTNKFVNTRKRYNRSFKCSERTTRIFFFHVTSEKILVLAEQLNVQDLE